MMGHGRLFTGLGALMIGGMLAVGGSSAILAQDATPAAMTAGHPAHIHAGTCDTLGDVVQPLSDVVDPHGGMTGDSAGSMQGNMNGITAASSFTTVPLPMDAILGADHAINVHMSADDIGTYIACGDIGGMADMNGALIIGLRELDGSGYSGIAILSPNAGDAGQTDVSVFIAEGLSEDGMGGMGAPMASPEATPSA